MLMTKVQLRYDLVHPLREDQLDGIARAHSVYGIVRVTVAPSLDSLTVDYDASRLTAREVEAELWRAGIPVKRRV
jgi:hypothetical protein